MTKYVYNKKADIRLVKLYTDCIERACNGDFDNVPVKPDVWWDYIVMKMSSQFKHKFTAKALESRLQRLTKRFANDDQEVIEIFEKAL